MVSEVRSSLSRAKSPGFTTSQVPFRLGIRLEVLGAGRILPSAAGLRIGESRAVDTRAFRCIAPASLGWAIESAHPVTRLGWSECGPEISRG